MNSVENIRHAIEKKIGAAAGLQAAILFDFADEGQIFVNTKEQPAVIVENPSTVPETDLTLSCSIATFAAILGGDQDPNLAFMMGKLKIKGSMGLAMKLNAILED